MSRSSWLLFLVLPILFFTARSTPILPQDARLVSSSVWNFHRSLGSPRVEAFDTDSLICQVTGDVQEQELVSVDFNFWYALGVDHALAMMDILKLEHQLFRTIEDNLLWCWSAEDTLVEARSHNNSGRLLKDADMARRRFTKEARSLGIVAFSIGGLDEQTDLECPEKTAEQLQETGSTDCIVVKGQMRIIAHAGNDVSYAIASIRDGLQAAMQDATFIQKLGMNFVRFLQYLGDSEEEALLPFVEDAIVDSDGDGVDDTTGSFPNIAETETVDSDGDTIIDNEDLFPNDPTEHKDKDDGGVGNNADAFPNDPTGTTDSDGDGVGDNTDAFLNDAAETTDSDGDGVGGNAGAFPSDPSEALDSDGDGVADNADAFPRDPFEWQDTDRDGVGDNGDAYPYDGTKTQDNRNGTEPIAVINEEEDDDSSVPLIFAFGLPLIVVLFLAGFFADKKKKAVVASALNNLRNSQFVGTGDPPKSYHEGLYHHLQNGARYLSTRCEQCRETRKNSFYVDDNLGTIREDEVYDDNMYGMDGNPSSDSSSGPQTGLATKFKGMDVHKCKSALCQRCNPPKKQRIQFLPTGLRRENNQDSPKSDERSDVPFSSDDFATKLEYFSERSEV